MNINLIEINGFRAAFASMFMSKRTWTPELQSEINGVINNVIDNRGFINSELQLEVNYDINNVINNQSSINLVDNNDYEKFNNWLNMLIKISTKHITLARFISFSCIVEGLHRGAQDDFDSHAKRLENRIIRNSTRLATFDGDEKSEFYKDKILLFDEVIKTLKDQGIDVNLPESIIYNDVKYIKAANGYINEKYKDNKDVKRGLYPLCIPSNFVFECNLTEWAHIVKERGLTSHAHPELIKMVDDINNKLAEQYPQFTVDWFMNIKN